MVLLAHGLRSHTPLRVGGSAGDGFEETDPVEAEVEQVDQTHTEGSEEVERLTDKMTAWRRCESATIILSDTNIH